MAAIEVYVLNFHYIFSHIEIVLKNTSTTPSSYFVINRWENPRDSWDTNGGKELITQADSIYSFKIHANPDDITTKWNAYWSDTQKGAHILGNNCAVAAQWFLTEFAGIPKPNLSNVSWNHLALSIIWPSFIPCPVTLPGRIMSNARFHVEAKTNPEIANQYTTLFLYTSMALATVMFATSIFAISVAATILSGGIAAAVIAGCATVGLLSTYGFFKAHNLLSAKNISANTHLSSEQYLSISI